MVTSHIREQHKEIAIKIAVAVGLCWAFFYFMIRPVFLESVTLRQEIRDSGVRLGIFGEVRRLKDELLVAEQLFPVVTARSSLVGKISDIANKKKIDVQTLTPKTLPEGDYVKLRIELSGQASFSSIIAFLKEMEAFEPPLSVVSLSLVQQSYVRTKENPGGKLQLQLSLETYLLKQARGRTPP